MATKKIIGVVIAVLLVAVLLVPAMGSVYEDTTNRLVQDEGTEYNVTGDVVSNVTNISSGTSLDVTLTDNSTTQSFTGLNEGENVTASMSNGDIGINVTNIDTNTATLEYSYSKTRSWTSDAVSMIGMVMTVAIIAVALFILKQADGI